MTPKPFEQNRFDLIRLLLAASVFAYHAAALSAFAPGGPLETGLAHLAELSIQGFFIVSGALVAGSLARSASLPDYAGKRVRRLYPAYALVILVPAAISFALTRDGPGVLRYLAANLSFLNFLEPNLPGLFAHNRFTEVNGALWTLKIEVMFYITLPLILLVLKALRGAWWVGILAIYVAAEAWAALMPGLADAHLGQALARQLPGQMAFFAMGIAIWKSEAHLRRRWRALGLSGALLLAATLMHPALEPLRALALAGLISAIAFAPGPALNAARFGDISYGLYIIHFPVLQVLLAAGLLATLGAPAFFALAAGLVIAASFALWHLIEKPALRPSSHYRKVAESKSS
ncbi:acyltransferase [Hyphomonas sp.]|uniref:acyltransferase family protein n=1 Tax=Hyphomonas sp. TaxID=87 RepID=UPI0025C01865|nr:acyltransferase [Hyphomonas sp.]